MTEIPGSDSPDKYQPTYRMEGKSLETWKTFWQGMFGGSELKPDEVSQMTDLFVKQISKQVGHLLDRALKVQKAIRRSYESGESPEAV